MHIVLEPSGVSQIHGPIAEHFNSCACKSGKKIKTSLNPLLFQCFGDILCAAFSTNLQAHVLIFDHSK